MFITPFMPNGKLASSSEKKDYWELIASEFTIFAKDSFKPTTYIPKTILEPEHAHA